MSSPSTYPAKAAAVSPHVVIGAILFASAAAGIVLIKSLAGMKALAFAQANGQLGAKARLFPLDGLPSWAWPVADVANYFSFIFVALTFGILIGALVRAALPTAVLAKALGAPGPAGFALGALLGAPLMLCSCCITPVFDAAYARTRKLGPSLALMFAAPGLNPIALSITFFVFSPQIAVSRVFLSLVIVFGVSALLARNHQPSVAAESCVVDGPAPFGDFAGSLLRSLRSTARASLPGMLVGVVVSVLLVQLLPFGELAKLSSVALLTTLLVALLATLIALPTFGEIPIALGLGLAGAPDAAVLAVLVAGPIINLPSLAVLRRSLPARTAAAAGAGVFAVAFVGAELATRLS